MYGNLPTVLGVEFVPSPPDTYSAMQFRPPGISSEAGENDTGWIAQFYLYPNY
jgi:hypothetical protein